MLNTSSAYYLNEIKLKETNLRFYYQLHKAYLKMNKKIVNIIWCISCITIGAPIYNINDSTLAVKPEIR